MEAIKLLSIGPLVVLLRMTLQILLDFPRHLSLLLSRVKPLQKVLDHLVRPHQSQQIQLTFISFSLLKMDIIGAVGISNAVDGDWLVAEAQLVFLPSCCFRNDLCVRLQLLFPNSLYVVVSQDLQQLVLGVGEEAFEGDQRFFWFSHFYIRHCAMIDRLLSHQFNQLVQVFYCDFVFDGKQLLLPLFHYFFIQRLLSLGPFSFFIALYQLSGIKQTTSRLPRRLVLEVSFPKNLVFDLTFIAAPVDYFLDLVLLFSIFRHL